MQPWFIASFFDIGHLGYSQLKKEIMHADWFKIILIYILMIKNMFSVFLSNYGSTSESLRELKKAVETLALQLDCSHSIPPSPKLQK